ncbi:hypothetical protein SB816_32535, partial [Achromobacter sp. SIMBA_011]|uniref:hypothetical protein n=1 Tax=Achromobacter sp. SIMBA_011 TaxID=3085759 RepID=UPI00397A85E2
MSAVHCAHEPGIRNVFVERNHFAALIFDRVNSLLLEFIVLLSLVISRSGVQYANVACPALPTAASVGTAAQLAIATPKVNR